MSIDSVLSQLESYKLTCDAADVEVVDSDKPERHHRLDRDPASGETRCRSGSTIKFRVSDGTGQQRPPAHHGMDIPPATEQDIVKVEIYVGDEPNPQYSEI